MFSTVRPCVRACAVANAVSFARGGIKILKPPNPPPSTHPGSSRPSEDLSSVGINILIMLALSCSFGVFQIRSTHSHNNSIYVATAEYYNIIHPIRIHKRYPYKNTYIISYILNEDDLSCTV